MSYVDEILLLRDADSDTEIVIEREGGGADDGAVIEIRVALGYSTPSSAHRGYVRLTPSDLEKLATWLGHSLGDEVQR
jgi:hypothetical protein